MAGWGPMHLFLIAVTVSFFVLLNFAFRLSPDSGRAQSTGAPQPGQTRSPGESFRPQ